MKIIRYSNVFINLKTFVKQKFSLYILHSIIGIFAVIILVDKRWEHDARVIESDVKGYYAYLTATFIYKDITLSFLETDDFPLKRNFWAERIEGKRFIKYNIGMSILYFPFFLLGHLFAILTDVDANGYSGPYKFFLQFSCLFYVYVGLFFLRKVLLKWFSDKITGITILLITLGTNLFFYSSYENTMPHAYNFSLTCIAIYFIIKWYEHTSYKNSIILGLISGLIALVRPTDSFLIIFLFLLYGIIGFNDLKNRFNFIIRNFVFLLLILLFSVILWIPQFMYWDKIFGNWLFYTYGVHGGEFFFDNPQIINGLFSYRKGWFVYTPLMVFSMFGIGFLSQKARQMFLPILIFMIFFIYFTFSWWSWWYGGGFSQRAMVDTYGLLAIPLAAFLKWLSTKRYNIKIPLSCILFIILGLNIFNTVQYKRGVIHYDSMTKEAYWAVFGELHTKNEDRDLMCKPKVHLAKKGIYECTPYTELENHGW